MQIKQMDSKGHNCQRNSLSNFVKTISSVLFKIRLLHFHYARQCGAHLVILFPCSATCWNLKTKHLTRILEEANVAQLTVRKIFNVQATVPFSYENVLRCLVETSVFAHHDATRFAFPLK